MPASLRETLRAATRQAHDAVEQSVDILRADLTHSEYVAYLCALHGYYDIVEPALIYADMTYCGGALDLKGRAKLAWLKDDLQISSPQIQLEKLPALQSFRPVNNAANLVGRSYVMEGSTLGSAMISRHVQKCLNITPEKGGRFLHGYGAATGSMWNRFVAAIDALQFSDAQRTECVDAAIETFDQIRGWLMFALPADAEHKVSSLN